MMFRVILNAERDMVYRFQLFIGGTRINMIYNTHKDLRIKMFLPLFEQKKSLCIGRLGKMSMIPPYTGGVLVIYSNLQGGGMR